MNIQWFESLPSTNRYCESLDPREVEDFTCVAALEQTAGIGQRGNVWHSQAGSNLTFSLMLKPSFLAAERQFALTEMLSVAVVELLGKYGIAATIKWPNDIYIANRKVCGMLVQNRLHGGRIAQSICGVGLNVGQTLFPAWIPNPTSMAIEGAEATPEAVLLQLLPLIEAHYRQLRSGESLRELYLQHLYRLNTEAEYILQGHLLRATITGIDSIGRLLLRTTTGKQIVCGMKEVRFVV